MYTCPYCQATKETLCSANGNPRKSCGQPACVVKARNASRGKKDSQEYTCPYCATTKLVCRTIDRKTCGDRKCVDEYVKEQRRVLKQEQSPKPMLRNQIDLSLPELKSNFPYFYSIVRVNKPKLVKCLRCPRTFMGSNSHRICFDCSDIRVGALALI